MLRKYSCNKYRSYSIRSHYFVDGRFETSDPAVQALIEGADGYGVFIHPVETPEEIAQMKAVEEAARKANEPPAAAEELPPEEEPAPMVVQGARGTHAGRPQRKGMFIEVEKKK